ncbi:MAG: apolipoprotein N-acyltransferase [Myxococcota bacterium]|nr:apolipoprotein N-acyltransferase [Myxococcota bacterium]
MSEEARKDAGSFSVAQWIDGLGFGPRLAIASTSGFVISMGAPRDGVLVASFVGFVPLLAILLRSRDAARRVFLLGFMGGMGIGVGGSPWIAEMLVKFAHVPTAVGFVGLLGFSSWMAISYGIFALLVRYGPRRGALGFAYIVAAFVAMQVSWPVLFEYTAFLGFAERPALMQLAEWIGVHGIEGVMVAAQLSLTGALLERGGARRTVRVAAWALTPVVMIAIGEARIETIEREAKAATKTLRIGIVQPNIGIFRIDTGRRLDRLHGPTLEAVRRGAELIVWPEGGVFPYPIGRPFEEYAPRIARRIQRGHRKPVLFGSSSREPDARFGYNSTFLIDRNRKVVAGYDKVKLVPFGEKVPLINPDILTDWVGNIAHHHAGAGPGRFVVEREDGLESVVFAPVICFEDIIPSYVREVAAQEGGVELLINQTIDSWYGDTAEPWEHMALAQFRAVEHRVPIVRSVSTGVSMIADATGRLVDYIPLRPVERGTLDDYPPEVLVATLGLARNTEQQPTFYARMGWLLPHFCQLATLVGLVGWRLRGRRGAAVS